MKPKKNLQHALNKAVQYLQSGNRELAFKHLTKFSKGSPNNADTHRDIGIFFQQNNMPIKAEMFYRDSLSINNDQASVYFNLGVIYQSLNKTQQAIEAYTTATELSNDYAKAFANLGYLYNEIGDKEKCKEACLSAKELEPDNPQIKHMIAALGVEESPEIADQQYIKNLYDDYAKTYDSHLSVTLKSRVPQLIYETTKQFSGNSKLDKTILDLGCGTGICGELFSTKANILDGVDLSEKMIEAAQKKSIYNNLYIADISEFLIDKENIYDIIFSSDVLIYIGNLLELFQRIKSALKNNGIFTFSTESAKDTENDFILDSTGRYKHNHDYITRIAEEAGLKMLSSKETALRQQNNEDVIGRIYVLTSE